jgi:hydroxyethylthiazole kinase-like uncharacterized protein yjeF
MTPVLSRERMRAFDAHAMSACHVPGIVLMENAGRGAADVVGRDVLGGDAAGARVGVVCGTGNNGGDGFVVARRLLGAGARVDLWLVGDRARVKGDAARNLAAFEGVGGVIHPLANDADFAVLAETLSHVAVVVDALFGTGLDRDIDGVYARAIDAINASKRAVVAIDLPSGLDANTGRVFGVCVSAERTVTFAHYKLGLLTPNGARLAGRVHVVDIGVPGSLVTQVGIDAERVDARDVAVWLGPRSADSHKNSAGNVLVIGGSAGKTGAPLLAAHAALRAGAGVATIATWNESAASIEARSLETMTLSIDRRRITTSLDYAIPGRRAIAMGPGFGTDADARAAVEHVLATFEGTVVVDADALTCFAGNPEAFASAHAVVLTPHPGEAARLLGVTAAEIERDRFTSARELAKRSNAVVVLKGAYTIIAAPDRTLRINPAATSALATAGSGDALSGTIAAVSSSLEPFDAASAGVFIHGASGEAWAHAYGDRGMLAHEIADGLPAAIAALAAAHGGCSV